MSHRARIPRARGLHPAQAHPRRDGHRGARARARERHPREGLPHARAHPLRAAVSGRRDGGHGDVLRDADIVRHAVTAVGHGIDGQLVPERAAILAVVQYLALERLVVVQCRAAGPEYQYC